MASIDENLIYAMAKALYQGYDTYKDGHPKLKHWGVESCLDVIGSDIPLHPGVVRYFKEIGKWTSEHEAWQQKVLAEEAQMIEAFKAGTLVQADTALDIWKAATTKY